MRKVFFSFHYQRDCARAGIVRNSNIVETRYEQNRFVDNAEWESVKRKDDASIKQWIRNQLFGTTVTVVLIGAKTADRKWINFEIEESLLRGNGLLGIYIHNCSHFSEGCDTKGRNPFESLYVMESLGRLPLSRIYRTYDWEDHNGRLMMGSWIEDAFQTRKKRLLL